MKNEKPRMMRRLHDGAVLPVLEERDGEICVQEDFPFWSPSGTVMKPLKLWHKKEKYESVAAARPVGRGRMSDKELTPEQTERWRRVLSMTLGPYALIMPAEEVQKLRDKFQRDVDKVAAVKEEGEGEQ